MTQDEINHAIAEHLGIQTKVKLWRFTYTYNGAKGTSGDHPSRKEAEFHAAGMERAYGGPCSEPEEYADDAEIPNYAGDLNAMHEAEKTLTYEQHCQNTDTLEMIVGGPAYKPATYATATQRAEAFLLTVGKWKEAA